MATPRRQAIACAIAAMFVGCAGSLACVAPASAAAPAATPKARPARAAAPGAGTAVTPPLGGVDVVDLRRGSTTAEADRAIATAKTLHARLVRTEIPWAVYEPGPGQVDPAAQAFTDRLMSDASAAGIRVIATVDSSPCWASGAPAAQLAGCTPGGNSEANSWAPADPSTYARFVAFLAARYGSALAAIEVWNEPDQINEAYFKGPNKAARYATLLRAAYPAIKAVNPGVAVLAGSLVGSNGVFLRALYAAGIKGYYDGLAVHFYTLTLAALRELHAVQLANGDHAPLWLDEFGWTSCWPEQSIQQEQACVTRATQALNLTNTFRSLARTPWVAAEVVYRLIDSRQEQFGLLTSAGARKPALGALASVLRSPFGRVSPVTLTLRRSGGRITAVGSGPVGDYLQLEAFHGRALRFRALFALDRFNQYSIALPSVLGQRGLRVRVYSMWSGPGAGAQRRI